MHLIDLNNLLLLDAPLGEEIEYFFITKLKYKWKDLATNHNQYLFLNCYIANNPEYKPVDIITSSYQLCI